MVNSRHGVLFAKIAWLPLYLIPLWIMPVWNVVREGFTVYHTVATLMMLGISAFCIYIAIKYSRPQSNKQQKVK